MWSGNEPFNILEWLVIVDSLSDLFPNVFVLRYGYENMFRVN